MSDSEDVWEDNIAGVKLVRETCFCGCHMGKMPGNC